VEETRAEDHRRKRKRSLGRGQVEGRESDEIPELADCGVGLLVSIEPCAERLRVELLARRIELAERRRRAERAEAVAHAKGRVAQECWDEVKRCGEGCAAQER